MKIGKRILSVLLCLAMLLSMLSSFAFAETKAGGAAPLPTGDANSLTGAKPTTDVALTIDANAIVVDGTLTGETDNYVLNWNGTQYEGMFTYGVNLFATIAEAQNAMLPGSTVLVKAVHPSESSSFIFTKAAKYYTENYNTLPYVQGTAFDGSDWAVNEAYAAKAVTLGNIKFQLADADATDNVQDAGTMALYGFSFKFSGTASISFNEMPDVRADFIIQNSAVNVSGGSPVITASTYAGGDKGNAKGASMLFKNFYMTGSATRLFTEYVADFFTIDGWYVPEEFGDTSYLWYLKTGATSGKSKLQITNSNFQGWKAHIFFEMNSGKNWFAAKGDSTISGASSDIEFRPVYITNNIFKNSSLWDKSAFHQTHANGTSKTVITGNRIINKEAVVPFLVNNSAKYGNYFSLEMYNNYIEGYASNPNFAENLSVGSSSAKTFVDIRNNYFSDNTTAKTGTDYWIGCTGNAARDVHSTDWYLDANMTLLNSEVKPLEIKTVTATNGTANVYNLATAHTIVYNLKEGAADLSFTFETDGAQAAWYSDISCTTPLDPATIQAGDSKVAYIKVTIPEKTATITYAVYIFKSDKFFSDDFTSDEELFSKDMLLVSNMNDNALAKYSTGQPLEYTLPHSGETYTFVKGINAFSSVSDALYFAEGIGIEVPVIYFDYSKEGDSIAINHAVKIVAPNYNVSPFDDKGFSQSSEVSDGTGTKAWTYNAEYDALKRTVANFKFTGNIAPGVEIYGVELKGSSSAETKFDFTGRSADDAASKLVFQNILITNATSGIFRFFLDACVEDDVGLVKNLYLRTSNAGGQLSLNSEYMPETMTFDGLFTDYAALGNDNKNSTRWYLKQGNSANTLTFKNCNLRNLYNENNIFLTLMGKGERPKEDAGSTKLVFEHNIMHNFVTGSNAFFGFAGTGGDYTNLTLKNNYIAAPAGMSVNLISSSKSTIQLKIDMSGNIIKGLNDLGAERALNNSSDIKMNYSTKVSSTDNTVAGGAIVLNGLNNTIVSKNHYLDYDMKLLNSAVEISNVAFSKGILETNELKYKFTGIVKEGTPATVADFTFDVPEEGTYTWYEDSELTKPIATEDLSKVDMYYTPVYLKVYAEGNPDQYIAYSFDLRTEPTPTNLFSETFVDPAGIINVNKAFIVSKSFDKYSDGAYVEASFGSDTLYSFVKGENAFNTHEDVLDYAKANGISTPHILVHDYTGLGKTTSGASAIIINTPAYYFTQNYNVNPVIKGTAPDGSDWGGNIGTGEGQFDPDKSVKLLSITLPSTSTTGEYKFYGFTLTGHVRDGTLRKQDIDVEFVNTYFDRAQWSDYIFAFNKPTSTSFTDAQKAFNESFIIRNMFFSPTSMTAKAKLFEGNLPATVIIEDSYFAAERNFVTGLNSHEFTCQSTTRSFQLRNSYLRDFFFKSSGNLMKNTQTGSDITAKEYAEFIIDGCTLVDVSFSGKSVFSADFDGLNLVQITNNKVYNDKINLAPISSINTTDAAKIEMKLVMTNNYFNAIKTTAVTLKRSLTDDSVIGDNYAIAKHKDYDGSVTYGGVALTVAGIKGDYFVDSELKYHRTDAIPATFVGEKTQLTDTGAKYLVTENDPVIAPADGGKYVVDVSSIVKNPAGNKVEIQIGDEIADLSAMPMTVELDSADDVEISVIGHALSGENTVTSKLLLTTKLAQINAVTVGDITADKNGNAFSAVLPATGNGEQITASAVADGTQITITDENGQPATNVSLTAGNVMTYTIVATIGNDTKTYTLTVTRESGDKTELINELEELIAKAVESKDQNGKTWLPGAKAELEEKISDAYAVIDEKKSAAELSQAIADLTLALDSAESSAELIEDYNRKLEEAKAIDNADGNYCAPTYAVLTDAIANAERMFEIAISSETIADIISSLDEAVANLATHSFTNYVHVEGSENCSSNGVMSAICDTPGCTLPDVIPETEDYKNDDHDFVDYIYNGDATMEQDGTETGHCSRCGEEDTRIAEGSRLDYVDSAIKFDDIDEDDWFKVYTDYVATFGLMNGKGATQFAPQATVTRAEFVQVLANMTGIDLSDSVNDTQFTDMKDGDWYVAAVRWAAANGIVSGKSPTTFAPNAKITREEMCVMLVNYANFKGIELEKIYKKFTFKDNAQISKWAAEQVSLCQQAGLIEGDGTNFYPKDNAKRCEMAVIVSKFHVSYMLFDIVE